ncbi:MAG: IS607 family transposase [Clostridiales Family XIII bacterium]|jgi:excisionase family DNA binding protein|nr:IS607 family transposase [Clostridiales Family XIII bacterium]
MMTITEFAKTIGVIPDTVRRWERSGKIKPMRTVGGHRRYTEKDVSDALRLKMRDKPKRKIIYCRVSGPNQKDDLRSQVEAMETFALGRGLITETVTEIGGGMNMSRPKFLKLVTDIVNGDVDTVIVAHKDRLARFGFDLVDNLAKTYGCEILVVNCEKLSPQAEMVEDLMSIIHTFSCRLYSLRKYKKAKDLISDETGAQDTDISE